ncbi:MAG: hypothetical protein IPM79_30815 [Polyangiaceae bacterium]|nr:hypothetical protein [Polyangiaceae bacterium]
MRYDALSVQAELRVAKAWELIELTQRLVGLAIFGEGTLDVADVLGHASQACGAAAMASSPRASDLVLGRVRATRGARPLVIAHERRPIDPGDFFAALTIAALLRDGPALAALRRAVDDVEPNTAMSTRPGSERGAFRRAYLAIALGASAGRTSASEAAADALAHAEELIERLDEYRADRLRNLVLPLVAGLGASDPAAALERAMLAHEQHWAEARRAGDPLGAVPWGPLALAAVLGLRSEAFPWKRAEETEAGRELMSLLDSAPEATALSYDVPPLTARTLDEALLRVELSSPGAVDVALRSEALAGATEARIEAKDGVTYHYLFTLDEGAPRGSLDAGELLHVAERERERMRTLPDGSEERAAARRLGHTCANAALLQLGEDDEYFRDRMTSPLGRALCDEQPQKFTRAAIAALVAELG